MHTLLKSAPPRQQKPVFQVLESAALTDEAAEAKNNRRSDKTHLKDYGKPQISFAFSFPLCDLLICELEYAEVSHSITVGAEQSTPSSETVTGFHKVYPTLQKPLETLPNSVLHRTFGSAKTRHSDIPSPGAALVSMADFVYSKVTSRAIRFIWPNKKKNPSYVIPYVQETLECGHIIDVHPSDTEKLTARKRQCHECQGFFGGLDLKKPSNGAKAAQRSRATGKVNWPSVAFALAAAVIIAAIGYYKAPKSYIYAEPTDTWRILSDVTPAGEVIMQRVHEGRALPPWEMHFCSDYKPLFEIGMSLNWFAFEDRGSCVSIARKDLGYVIDRGPDTWPTLARNCQYHINPTVAWGKSSGCDGKPRFD